MTDRPTLEIRGVAKSFGTAGPFSRKAAVRALRGVDLEVHPGETLAVVGESGCGKTTLGRIAVGLDAASSGEVRFAGQALDKLDGRGRRHFRRSVQMIFQDSYGSLNPFHSVERLVSEPWRAFPDLVARPQRHQEVLRLLETVGLGPEHAERLPRQLSGGQRQRVGIARALAVKPAIIVCDEPVSALDVSVQAQIINLLRKLQRELQVSYLFISHDLRLVSYLADRIAVMYLGKVVEVGTAAQIFEQATHPYTQVLLSNASEPFPWHSPALRLPIGGDVPSPSNPPSGCGFRTRCWKARPQCAEAVPDLIDRIDVGHPSACHFPELTEDIDREAVEQQSTVQAEGVSPEPANGGTK